MFEKVKEGHIIKGITDYNEKGLPNGFGPSSTYDLVFEGKRYPPKAVMAYANYHAIGRKIERYFKGGLDTDCFKAFERNGFDVIPKGQEIESEIVKKEFARWLLKNATINYQPYYGKTIDSVIEKLNEINDFFDKDLFLVNKNTYKEMISYLKFKNGKEERLKNKVFYDYDRKHGKGRPIAILGKENYSKFLNTYFSENTKTNISLEKVLKPYIKKYKELITNSEEYDEIYKWEAIQNFQNHWDLNSSDLAGMIASSFPGNVNLWTSNNYYPINMLKDFANLFPEDTRQGLNNLFDENRDLANRVTEYKSAMDNILDKKNNLEGKEDRYHYQDGRTISLLLTFKYPDKYFLFKYAVLRAYCKKFDLDAPKKGDVVSQIIMNNQIGKRTKEILLEDRELLQMHADRVSNDSYKKDNYNILTQDFIYAIIQYLKKDESSTKYWALGFNSDYNRLKKFKEDDFWQAIDFSLEDESPGATRARKLFSQIKVGDKILIKGYGGSHDLNIHYKGEVIKVDSDDELLKLKPLAGRLYKGKAPRGSGAGQWRETIVQITRKNDIETFFYDKDQTDVEKSDKKSTYNGPLNQILYGPPGTGKTFNTLNLALKICGEEIKSLERKQIKKTYDQKVNEGQIIFSTFHQSMSYEDFIEGIKPIEPEKEGDPVIYKVVEGIFKKACIEASFNFAIENSTADTDDVLDFSLAYDNFLQNLENRLATGNDVELEIKNGGKVYVDSISTQGNIQIKHLNGQRIYTVSKRRLSKIQKVITNLDEITNINESFRAIIGGSNATAYWSVLNAIQKNTDLKDLKSLLNRKYTWEDKKEVVEALDTTVYKGKSGKPVVLIIDEINRGNVSAIFGELITLIEKDKRLGADEALLAKLPYSKEYFGVPPNLYIIGTMNTADRSVEALDSALRRRFSFIEMPPKPKFIKRYGAAPGGMVEEVDLVKLLKTINKRIEKLLDKDHTIGHSYFLKTKSLKGLKEVFANKVLPLLQEYFFGDYGKIGLVLGSGFVESVQGESDEKFFAAFEDYELGSFLERKVYRIKDAVKMSDEEFKNVLIQLLG